jgi:hypothetical protein
MNIYSCLFEHSNNEAYIFLKYIQDCIGLLVIM